MVLPEKISESSLEDIQSIEIDLNELERKYITPIELVRSLSAPQTLSRRSESRVFNQDTADRIRSDELNSAHTDREPQESRCHAFYRMIGLPVMSEDLGSFYNPGFNPSRTKLAVETRSSVSNRVPPIIRRMHQSREFDARSRLAVFKKGTTEASTFAVIMNILRPFQVINTSLSLLDQDNQRVPIPERRQKVLDNYLKADESEFESTDNVFDSVSHILRPMTVDPILESSVLSEDKIICEPFLKTQADTNISARVALKRPVIEQILRLRLKESTQTDLVNNIIFTLNSSEDVEGLSDADAVRIANALLAENKINGQNVTSINATSLEALRLNTLVKTIKALVDLLVKSVEQIKNVEENISWTPLPDTNGPEFVKDFSLSNLIIKKKQTSILDRRISSLLIKAAESNNLQRIGNRVIGDEDVFALSSFESNTKNFELELNESIEQRREYIRKGSNSLRAIEMITGEVSGLGLIDILAIYTALWAIDLDTLLSLLDNNAFERLIASSNSEINLRNSNVNNRIDNGTSFSVFEALQRFEAQVISILAFADKLIEQKMAVSKVAEGGSVVGA